MSNLEWVTPMFGSDHRDPSLKAIQDFLASNTPSSIGNKLPSTVTSGARCGDGLSRDIPVNNAAAKANGTLSFGNLSPPETSPSPPSSLGNSPSNPSVRETAPQLSTTTGQHQQTNGNGTTKRKGLEAGSESTGALKDRKGPTQGEHTHQPNSVDADASTTANGKTGKTSDRRRQQNRDAQRAFRERKEKRLHDLEEQVTALRTVQETKDVENANLRDLVSRLQQENQRLAVYEQAFTFTIDGTKAAPSSSTTPITMNIASNFLKSPSPAASPISAASSTFSAKPTSDIDTMLKSMQQHLKSAANYGQSQSCGRSSSRDRGRRSGSRSLSIGVGSSCSSSSGSSPVASFGIDTDSRGSSSFSAPGFGTTPDSAALFGVSDVSSIGTSGVSTSAALTSSIPTTTAPLTAMSNTIGCRGDTNIFSSLSGLTMLNSWDMNTMSFFSDPTAPSAGLSLPGLTPSNEFVDLFGSSSASYTGWDGGWTTGWGSGDSSGSSSSFGAPMAGDNCGNGTSLADRAGFDEWRQTDGPTLVISESLPLSNNGTGASSSPLPQAANSKCPEMQSFIASGVLSEGELDGLCQLMATKATCQEKSELLDQVVAHRPQLSGAVEAIKARRKAEILGGNYAS